MVFELGDVVPLFATVTLSGIDFDLSTNSGTSSGTIVGRNSIGLTPQLDINYRYKVQLPEPIVIGSGVGLLSEDLFWLTEGEINGSVFNTDLFDVNGLNDTLASGLDTVSNNRIIIQQTLSLIDTSSPYSDDIKRLVTNASDIESFLVSADTSQVNNNPSEQNQTASVISGYATTGAFSSNIFNEISDNLYGYYTVVNEAETELKTRSTLESEQDDLARADDQANFTVFYDTYVNNPVFTNLLSPSDTESEERGIDVNDLIDTSGLNDATLISGSLGLESN